jgi:hypothetical protein
VDLFESPLAGLAPDARAAIVAASAVPLAKKHVTDAHFSNGTATDEGIEKVGSLAPLSLSLSLSP